MLRSLPGLTVYDSLKQLLLSLEGSVVKENIMLPVVLKIFCNSLKLKLILIYTDRT